MKSEMQTIQAKAQRAFASGDFYLALQLLEAQELQMGLHSELANNLAVVHYKLGHVDRALELFRTALALQGEAQHLVANNLLDILQERNAVPEADAAHDPDPQPAAASAPSDRVEVAADCPVCKQVGVSFVPIPEFYRENARRHGFVYYGQGEMTAHETYSCNRCGSSDRERLYVYWLEQEIRGGRLRRGARMIHFAPEATLSRVIRGSGFFEYSTADLAMKGVDHQVDLMNLPFADETYDFFICSHVLEHVADDAKAIRELHRITRKGGCGILVAPIIVGLERTIEDPSVTDEAGRWRLYGQNDHLRLYAHDDYVSKVQENGFVVEQLGLE